MLQCMNADILAPPAETDVEAQQELGLLAPLGVHGLVQREYDAHVRAGFDQLLGQRADDVRQAAGLDEGYAFGCGKQNFHDGYLRVHLLCGVDLKRDVFADDDGVVDGRDQAAFVPDDDLLI